MCARVTSTTSTCGTAKLRKPSREPRTEEAEALSQLQAQLTEHSQRMDELYDQDDVDDEAESEISRLDALCTSVTAQMEAIQEALTVWPPDLMAQAGCLVFVGNDAQPAVRYGLVRPEDRDGLIQARRSSGVAGSDADPELASMPAPRTRPVHSGKLVRKLTAHRVAAIQAELLDRSDVALAVLTAQMAKSLLLDDYRQAYGCEDPLSLRVEDAHGGLRSDAQDMASGKAWQTLQAKRSHWQSVLPTQAADVLPWVLAQHPDTVRQLFTFLVAITVTGVYGTDPAQQRTDGIAQALNLDMTKWWEATGPSCFQHVSKARATEVVSEAGDVQAGTAMQPLKKDAAVAYAERAVAGRGWLPPILRVRAIGDRSPSCETSDALRAPHAPADAPHADIEESQESAAGGEDRAPWDEQPQEGQALAS